MIWALFLKRKRLKALLVEDCFIEFFSSLVLDYKPYNLNSTIVKWQAFGQRVVKEKF